jgi:hypothetical protein
LAIGLRLLTNTRDVDEEIDSQTTHAVASAFSEDLLQLQEGLPELIIVRPSWILQTNADQRLASLESHSLP